MILYYALGGGLGHLTRARAVIHTLDLHDVTILTTSPFATDLRVTGGLPVLAPPADLAQERAGWRAWLGAVLHRMTPDVLYLDAFPAGILGELCDLALPSGIAVVHLARRLRWEVYRRELRGTVPSLATAYLLEPLESAHATYLHANAQQCSPLLLDDPPAELRASDRALVAAVVVPDRPLWLVIHAGPAEEIAELLAYAEDRARLEQREPALVVVSPARPPDLPPAIPHLDIYPVTPLLPLANRIITAGGFNSLRQLAPYRERHWCVPFARRFDDQFARVSFWRAATMS